MLKAGIGRVVVLLKCANLQAILQEAADQFGQTVVPHHAGLHQIGIGVGIGALLRFDDGSGVEIAVGNRSELIVEHPHHRVEFHHNELAVGLQKMIDHRRPALQVGEPADGAVAGENNIEFTVEVIGKIVEVAANEIGQ